MRILIQSNSPIGPTGYAIVTRYLTRMFQELGHHVSIFAYWGIDSEHPLMWNNAQILPRWRDMWGKDIFMEHFIRTKSDILMPIFDIWVAPELPEKCDRIVAYVPTDHDPPAEVLHRVVQKCWKFIPFTEWSEKSMRKVGCKNIIQNIPHGVDTNICKPMNQEQCRKTWSIRKNDMDAFIIGIVAGNYDKEGRKRWDKQLEAIKIFKDQNPDCKLRVYLHTDVNNYAFGFDLRTMTKFFGLDKITYMTDPYYFISQLPYERMGEIYNIFDVHLLISSREGFGIPIIESQACGIPNISTDFAAGSELTHPDLRVKVAAKILTPLISWTAIPDAWDAAQKIEMLYKSPDKMEKYKKECYEFAQLYDWNGPLVKGRWIKALDVIQDELHKKKKGGI